MAQAPNTLSRNIQTIHEVKVLTGLRQMEGTAQRHLGHTQMVLSVSSCLTINKVKVHTTDLSQEEGTAQGHVGHSHQMALTCIQLEQMDGNIHTNTAACRICVRGTETRPPLKHCSLKHRHAILTVPSQMEARIYHNVIRFIRQITQAWRHYMRMEDIIILQCFGGIGQRSHQSLCPLRI